MSNFNQSNLTKGLATFLKLPAQQKRHNVAIRRFNDEVSGGASQRVAIERALKQAVKGLTDSKEKLSAARKAAGITVVGRATSLVPRTSQSKTAPTKKIVITDKMSNGHKWSLIFSAIIGSFFGLLIGMVAGPSMVAYYHSSLHTSASTDWLVWLGTVIVAVVLLGSAVYHFRARHLRHQLMANNSHPA